MPIDDRRNGEKEKQQEPRLDRVQPGKENGAPNFGGLDLTQGSEEPLDAGDPAEMDERIIRALQSMPDAEFEALAAFLADMRRRGQGPSVH